MAEIKPKVFLSFDYKPDVFRVSQIKQMGYIEEQPLLATNKWEEVKKKGEDSIKKWIDDNMKNKDCLIVLVGTRTSTKKWVKYEIEKAWNSGKGVAGIYIHNLKCPQTSYSVKGNNPFDIFTLKNNTVKLSSVVKCYDPSTIYYDIPTSTLLETGQAVYRNIQNNIKNYIIEAIEIRKNYK